ncbi:hypothetical protein [Gracilibacillus timonensis]|nr:hypothetical protein [Gracilibacillus timonensis]
MTINIDDLTRKERMDRSGSSSLLIPKQMAMITEVMIVVLTDFLSTFPYHFYQRNNYGCPPSGPYNG